MPTESTLRVSMLLLAAGRGTRLGSDVPKIWLRCGGRTLLERSARRLAEIDVDSELIVALHPDDRRRYWPAVEPALSSIALCKVVDGGATRQESMRRALAATNGDRPLVLVHDAARPFFPVGAARRAIEMAAERGAALLAVPAPDTLKRVDDDGRVTGTLERRGVWLAQTPQVLRRDLLEQGLDRAEREGHDLTDDVSLVERAGGDVRVVLGSPRNLKVTTAADLELADLVAALEDR